LIILINLSFLLCLIYFTFITHHLPIYCSLIFLGHLFILILLDKPHLFDESPYNPSKQSSSSSSTRKSHRSSTSSMVTTALNRLSYRSSTSGQPRKINSLGDSNTLTGWSRWSSVLEDKLDVHECTTIYSQARQEADEIWPVFLRRILLNIYRTISSFILFDFIPIKTIRKW